MHFTTYPYTEIFRNNLNSVLYFCFMRRWKLISCVRTDLWFFFGKSRFDSHHLLSGFYNSTLKSIFKLIHLCIVGAQRSLNTKLPMMNKYGDFSYAIYTFRKVTSHQLNSNQNVASPRSKHCKRCIQIQTNRNGKEVETPISSFVKWRRPNEDL